MIAWSAQVRMFIDISGTILWQGLLDRNTTYNITVNQYLEDNTELRWFRKVVINGALTIAHIAALVSLILVSCRKQ